MVAQTISNPLAEGFDQPSIEGEERDPLAEVDPLLEGGSSVGLETEDVMEDDLGGVNDDMSSQPGDDEEVSPKDKGRKTLTTYIFEKLQSYNYPGRRLQEFKSEFVSESISPEGVKDIEVVIPSEKYPDANGQTETIENEELKSISHEVNQMFGLNFNGAKNQNGKWSIQFTSADLSSPGEEIHHDSLESVYGKQDKGKQGNPGATGASLRAKEAFTIHEMIKDQKDNTVSKLKSIGEK